jgi:translation initiation factor IF-2
MTLKEFAQKYNVDPQELFDILIFEKFPIATIDDEVDTVICQYLVETTGLKAKKTKAKAGKQIKQNAQKSQNRNVNTKYSNNKENNKEEESHSIILESKTIGDLAFQSKVPVSAFINYFLKKGKLYSIHHVLTIDEIKEFAHTHAIAIEASTIEQNKQEKKEIVPHQKNILNTKGTNSRPPIIVIVGHVDHGKTSLLDFIRKQSVAKAEKGGITQHIGAYTVNRHNKDIVFLDTPGHAAFTALRERGASIADIAILIIAAEDGIMEQTKESIKMLQAIGTPIIVAITKIDKIKGERNFDKIFQQLTEYSIVPELWGGNVSCVGVSSITGEGIPELLDIINLTAELIDIKTNESVQPEGYILESKIEKGRGGVATVILYQGTLKIGDYFSVEDVSGKIVSLRDSTGTFLQSIKPSYPCIVGGFDSLPMVGGILKVATLKDVKKNIESSKEKQREQKQQNSRQELLKEQFPYRIIVKADVYSSLQAIIAAINKIKVDSDYVPVIMNASVGNILEADFDSAATSGSVVYAFGVKVDNNVKEIAEQKGVTIKHFDVIYHLLEHIESELIRKKHPVFIKKKIGELLALKIFDIKNLGIVIGFRVLSGIVKSHSEVSIIRNNHEVGSGTIKTLQKDRESVKELSKGHEGAILVDGFSDWHEQDKIEVYIKIAE